MLEAVRSPLICILVLVGCAHQPRTRSAPLGTAAPTEVGAVALDGRWVVLCQARDDTNHDGRLAAGEYRFPTVRLGRPPEDVLRRGHGCGIRDRPLDWKRLFGPRGRVHPRFAPARPQYGHGGT